ncbi:gp44 [Burkholderia phage BcepB1A]|uniref:gp44 n=1 Tax=Burkholderia phage BcepB1A TaxID=279530 RepID=UPI00003779A4|nr:gp44 [Burkholderia phage BcepB1A]AAT37745.1 gp44 [Burkholderia phage BcepB1A]
MLDMNKLDDLLMAYSRAVRADERSPTVNNKRCVGVAYGAVMTYVRDNMPAAANAPFDEAAARAGKPIECVWNGKWQATEFVGMRSNGDAVVDFGSHGISVMRVELIRMVAPKMRTLYLNIASQHVGVYRTEADAKKHAASGTTHIAYPVEVPE